MPKKTKEPCPCCHHLTIKSPGDYEICPVCFWEDDCDEEDGPNRITLAEARANYITIGACSPNSLRSVRKARAKEIPTH